MTERQRDLLCDWPNVRTAAEIAGGGDIPDPFGGTLENYIDISHALERVCNVLLQKMTEEL